MYCIKHKELGYVLPEDLWLFRGIQIEYIDDIAEAENPLLTLNMKKKIWNMREI